MRLKRLLLAALVACGARRHRTGRYHPGGGAVPDRARWPGLGIPERNTIELLPKTIAGQAVRWVVLDDASDTTAAVKRRA